VHSTDEPKLRALFAEKGWTFVGPSEVVAGLRAFADRLRERRGDVRNEAPRTQPVAVHGPRLGTAPSGLSVRPAIDVPAHAHAVVFSDAAPWPPRARGVAVYALMRLLRSTERGRAILGAASAGRSAGVRRAGDNQPVRIAKVLIPVGSCDPTVHVGRLPLRAARRN
jgi:hypothetical protein